MIMDENMMQMEIFWIGGKKKQSPNLLQKPNVLLNR